MASGLNLHRFDSPEVSQLISLFVLDFKLIEKHTWDHSSPHLSGLSSKVIWYQIVFPDLYRVTASLPSPAPPPLPRAGICCPVLRNSYCSQIPGIFRCLLQEGASVLSCLLLYLKLLQKYVVHSRCLINVSRMNQLPKQ
jgi:hypothetical protein